MTPYVFIFSGWVMLKRLGGPGLILLGLLDSSFVPIPGSMDALTIILAAGHRGYWWYYALMATAGSLLGGYLTYRVGRKGGKESLEKRFPKDKLQTVYKKFETGGGGFWALFIPALLPPPFPLTPFVVAAGALAYPRKKFLISLGAGRAVRYFTFALLAHIYGRSIIGFVARYKDFILWSFIALVAVGILAALGAYLWHRNKQKSVRRVRKPQTKVA